MPKTLHVKLKPFTTPQILEAWKMEIGDISQVEESNTHNVHFILRTFDGWVDLEKPNSTWSRYYNEKFSWRVRILSAGESITLTV